MPRSQQNVLTDLELRNFIKNGSAIVKSDGGGLLSRCLQRGLLRGYCAIDQ